MNSKIYLHHGENYYIVFKTLRELKKKLDSDNIEYKEIFGSRSLDYRIIYDALNSSTLFAGESAVILRNLGEGNSVYPFIDELINIFQKTNENANSLHIFHLGKLAKNTKIYKFIEKSGKVYEYTNPKTEEIISVINKSLDIKPAAAEKLALNINNDLFLLKNEIKKLSVLDKQITEKDIEEYCIHISNPNDVWGIGKLLIQYMMNKNEKNKILLINELNNSIINNVEPMQILYSFYNYVLNFIKMKEMVKNGKGFTECLPLGYYFVKEFFSYAGKIDTNDLYETNKLLLDYEFGVKSGEVEPIMGIRKFILSI